MSDPKAPAATRLKAAMEIVKLVQNQKPTDAAKLKVEHYFDRHFQDLDLAEVATSDPPQPPAVEVIPVPIQKTKEPVRNVPCPCGSRLKYKRCCGNPVASAA